MSAELILFWVFAIGCIGAALNVVWAKSPIASAMSLVGTFFFLAGLYVLLWAHTIAVLQVMVYAGAIMVLFLFVIMLLSLSEPEPRTRLSFARGVGAAASVALLFALVVALSKLHLPAPTWVTDAARLQSFGTLKQIGEAIYTTWLLPFEAVSILLLAAIVGAVVVAKPRI